MISRFFNHIWQEAYLQNTQNILDLLDKNPRANVLDVGCGDGRKTIMFKRKVGCLRIVGIDSVSGRIRAAKNRGVVTIQSNLEKRWGVKSNFFDVVISNQVIEHMFDLDHFIQEIYRVLKPGGYCIISTENLSSWHNIFALILGYQDFSQHLIKKAHVGNPLSLHHGQKTVVWSAKDNSGVDDTAHPHVKILTYLSLTEVFKEYGLKSVGSLASGYYPLFGLSAKLACRIDPFHSHFITVKLRK